MVSNQDFHTRNHSKNLNINNIREILNIRRKYGLNYSSCERYDKNISRICKYL